MREREGVRAQGYEAVGRGSGVSDPMRATDARIDAERKARDELGQYQDEVDGARRVCAGIRAANPSHPLWADAVELHWCDLRAWCEIAGLLGVSAESARRSAYAALDWVDSVGIAAAREGVGQAALF